MNANIMKHSEVVQRNIYVLVQMQTFKILGIKHRKKMKKNPQW